MLWSQYHGNEIASHKKEEGKPSAVQITEIAYKETPYASYKACEWVVRGAIRILDEPDVGTYSEWCRAKERR